MDTKLQYPELIQNAIKIRFRIKLIIFVSIKTLSTLKLTPMILFKDALIYDGTGTEAFRGDILVDNDRMGNCRP